ncbi:MAG TPA: PRC-barrel domain-containing protein [Planctomycetota bacterium]|nr:PRC-barrel domain-containing protein [Planctomycetota bacterium]
MVGRLSLAVSIPVLAVLIAAPLRAQDPGGGTPTHAAGKGAKAKADKPKDGKVAQHELPTDGNRAAGIHRANRMFESRVMTADGKDVGKVADLVLDPSDGRVQYAVLDAGSFLDARGKLFAVPVDALVGDTGSAHLRLVGIDRAALAAAPAFAKTEWPKDGDRDFVAKVWKQFGRKPYWDDKATGFTTMRLGTLLHAPLTNAKGEELGKIDNFAVDVLHGKLLYAIVHPSASTQAGEKAGEKGSDPNKGASAQTDRRVAVPWAALAKGATGRELVLDMDAAHFMTAPGFETGKWPEMSDAKWVADNADFFTGAGAAR